jgi:hypothetical protein
MRILRIATEPPAAAANITDRKRTRIPAPYSLTTGNTLLSRLATSLPCRSLQQGNEY